MIISRYLSKEVLNTLLAVTFVLLLIFLSNQLVRYLSSAAAGKFAANIVFQLMGFEIPFLLALLLPLGLYLGIVLAYGRLYADSEMHVLHACGLSMGRLIKITSWLAFSVAGVVLVLTVWINPWIASHKEKLITNSLSTDNILSTLLPGRFQVSSDGRRVLYVERISQNRDQANNLFIADQKTKSPEENNSWTVVSAAMGSHMKDPVTHDHFIVASDGYRYEGTPGQNDFKIVQFSKYAVRLPHTEITSKRQDQEAIPTTILWKNYQKLDNAAELQWRFSMPLLTLVLSLLAVPLSQIHPRQGRYAQLFPAILVYVVYVNMLFVARNWMEQKFVPLSVGMWWVHGLAFFCVMIFVACQMGWLRRPS